MRPDSGNKRELTLDELEKIDGGYVMDHKGVYLLIHDGNGSIKGQLSNKASGYEINSILTQSKYQGVSNKKITLEEYRKKFSKGI